MTMTLHKSTKSDGWSARRQLRASGCHVHTAASIEGAHVQGGRSSAIPKLFQYDSRRTGRQLPTRVTGLLKGLLNTVLQPLELEPVFPLNGTPPLKRAPIRHRIRCLIGCRSGRDLRELGHVLLIHRSSQ